MAADPRAINPFPSRTLRFAGAALLSALASAGAQAGDTSRLPSMQAVKFLDMLGVNARLEYNDGRYANADEAVADLDYLGVHRLRDYAPDPRSGVPYRNYLISLDDVAQAGNRVAFIVGPEQTLAHSFEQIDRLETGHPGTVDGIEMSDTAAAGFDGLTGARASEVFAAALIEMVRTDPHLGTVPVLAAPSGRPAGAVSGPALFDMATTRIYPTRGQTPASSLGQATRPSPTSVTEAGYVGEPANPNGNGVDTSTAAHLTLDMMFDAARDGFSSIYLYQLRSAYPDPKHNSDDVEFGLFAYDNTPKPAAVAIHNLTTSIAAGLREETDLPGPKTAPTPKLDGLPPEGRTLMLTAPNGVYDLVLWSEPPVWDAHAHRPIKSAAHVVTIDFPEPFAREATFDPTQGGGPIGRSGLGTRVSVTITDHPVVVQFKLIPRAT